MTAPTTVALVTLGCARNEVDSEELAGRLEAGGFRLVDDPADAETVVVNTCGFVEQAKKDCVDTLLAAADLKGTGRHPGRGRGRLPGGAVRRRARRRRCPRPTRCSASTTTPTSPPGCARSSPARRTTPTRRRTGASCCRSHPSTGRDRRRRGARPRSVGGRAGRDHRGRSARHRAAHRPAPARRRADGPAQAGQRVRPALLVLRDPELPRLVRLPAADRRARRGALAGRAGRARAVPGQRELHVLRQGPRRPAPPRDAAARARRGRRRGAGARVLPPARRDPAGPGHRDRVHARRGAVLRPLLPARVRPGAAADAPVRRRRELPRRCSSRSARRRPRRACAPTSSSASPARPRTTSRSCATSSSEARLDAIGVFGYSDEDGTEAASYDGEAGRRRGPRPGRARHPAGRGAHRPAGRGPDRRGGRGARRVGRRTTRWSAGPRTRAPRSTGRRTCVRRAGGVGDMVRAEVVGTDGVDLVAKATHERADEPRPGP